MRAENLFYYKLKIYFMERMLHRRNFFCILLRKIPEYTGGFCIFKMYKANFDARAFNIPIHEVINNLIWRQQDASRNSVNMVAQSLYNHKELQGIGVKDLQNKMLIEKNVNWNDFSVAEKRGVAAIKDNEGKWFIDELTPIFTEDRDYINRLVYPESDD